MAEREAKRAEAEAEKERTWAEQAATHGLGRGRGGCGRGRGRGSWGQSGRGRGGRKTALATQESDGHSEEGILDSESDSNGTQSDDIPIPGITETHSQRHLTWECRARAPRFFADDDDEDAPAHVIQVHPRPSPRPIPIWSVMVQLTPESINSSSLPPKHDDVEAERVPIVLVTSMEKGPEVQAYPNPPTQPNCRQVGPEQPAPAQTLPQSGNDQYKVVEVSTLRAILSGEQSIVPIESGLPQRHTAVHGF